MSEEKKAKSKIVLRTKRFMKNPLLHRKQFVLEVEHPGRGTVPKKEIQAKMVQIFGVKEENTVVLYGFHTKFGGGKSTGYGAIYDTLQHCKRYEPRYRLIRMGVITKKEHARRQKKEKKNKMKKKRGLKKVQDVPKKK
eukprot:NODE_3729_length_527_cov_802.336820_g3169_i0.p2 GENE.NODE_3729_length_527_cov_802.336820_g3169_i0~~NODE_3729_length_527_cov_802.336820_g3169_i0.p2  ORF type:complete len:158 (-),score=59.18 NODE_3729_length_527_cov_802.336820_g3169_i0:52-465(-)